VTDVNTDEHRAAVEAGDVVDKELVHQLTERARAGTAAVW
jgi:hypothetical protein